MCVWTKFGDLIEFHIISDKVCFSRLQLTAAIYALISIYILYTKKPILHRIYKYDSS